MATALTANKVSTGLATIASVSPTLYPRVAGRGTKPTSGFHSANNCFSLIVPEVAEVNPESGIVVLFCKRIEFVLHAIN